MVILVPNLNNLFFLNLQIIYVSNPYYNPLKLQFRVQQDKPLEKQ